MIDLGKFQELITSELKKTTGGVETLVLKLNGDRGEIRVDVNNRRMQILSKGDNNTAEVSFTKDRFILETAYTAHFKTGQRKLIRLSTPLWTLKTIGDSTEFVLERYEAGIEKVLAEGFREGKETINRWT